MGATKPVTPNDTHVGLTLLLLAVQVSTGWFVLGSIAFVLLASYMLGGLFGHRPKYRIPNPEQLPSNDSRNFLDLVESLTDARINYAALRSLDQWAQFLSGRA